MNKQVLSPIVCSHCQQESDLFKVNCQHCGNVLRDRIPNIDLGEVIIRIIDSPSVAFAKIIFAEKKNYLLILVILLSIKNSIMYQSANAILFGWEYFRPGEIQFVFLLLILSLIIASSVVGLASKKKKQRLQIKQIGAAVLFSQLPIIFAFTILIIPEYVIFGKYIFYKNPTIFFIHPFFSYFFLLIETGFYIWAFVLTILACSHFFDKKIIVFITAAFFILTLHFFPYLILTQVIYK